MHIYRLMRVMVFSHQSKTTTRQRQDNNKTNFEPVHSYDAFHTRFVGPGVKGIIGMHRFNICLVVVLLWCENTINALSRQVKPNSNILLEFPKFPYSLGLCIATGIHHIANRFVRVF